MIPAKVKISRQITILALLACVSLLGCKDWFGGAPKDSQEEITRTVYALGHLKPATGVVDVIATPGDRLKSLVKGVEANALIPADGILGTLDSYDMGREQLLALVQKKQLARQKYYHQKELAAAQLAQADATKAQAQAKKSEVALQKEKLEVLKESVALEQTEYDKLALIWADDPELVTEHQLRKQENQLDLAKQDLRIAEESYKTSLIAAEAAATAAEASYSVAEMTNRQANREFDLQIETQLIDQEIEIAEEALERSVLLAPNYSDSALEKFISVKLPSENGEAISDQLEEAASEDEATQSEPSQYTVLRIFLGDGEVVTQSPIMQLGELSKMICVAEVYEADRKELFLNQEVIIRSPAFSGFFADGGKDEKLGRRKGGIIGKVTQIGRMIAPPGLPNRNPLAPSDRSVVEVQIEIDIKANEKVIETIKQSYSDQEIKIDPDWDENANEQAAKHVGLQVTVEFCPHEEEQESQAADKAKQPQASN